MPVRDPTPAERAWLQLVFDHFVADGAWPRAAELQLELDRADRDLNVEEVARELPPELGYLRQDAERAARITVRGMTFCAGAEPLLEQFVKGVELFTEKYLASDRVTRAELAAAIGGDERQVRLVFLLLDREGYFLSDGDGPDGEWTRSVSRQAREFRKVHSVNEFLARLDELAGRRGPVAEALQRAVDATARLVGRDAGGEPPLPSRDEEPARRIYDAFIAHATADKNAVARPLAEELRSRGYEVWYDEWTLTVGDSLRQKIDEGLRQSRYGAVVLSPSFFERSWPQRELDGLAARELGGTKVILPVWHELDHDDVAARSPLLAGRVAARTAMGIARVADDLAVVLGAPAQAAPGAPGRSAQRPPPAPAAGEPESGVGVYRRVSAQLDAHDEVRVRREARALGGALRAAVGRAVEQSLTKRLPDAVANASRLESWSTVLDPLFAECRSEVDAFLGGAIACVEYESALLQLFVDELVRIFDERPATSGAIWVLAFPQLVAVVVANALLAAAVAVRQWNSFVRVASPRLTGYGGRSKPWVLHTDFIHAKSVGDRANVAGAVVLAHLRASGFAAELNLDPADCDAAASDASTLLGVIDLAFETPTDSMYFWGYETGPSRGVVTAVARDPEAVPALARLSGEDPEVFRANFAQRMRTQAQRVMNSGGRWRHAGPGVSELDGLFRPENV